MSKIYALALIVLGTTILGSLIWLHFHLMGRQHAKLFTYAHSVNERTIEQSRQEIDMLHWTTKEFFLDDIYTRRSIVLNIFTEAELRLEKYFKALDQSDRDHTYVDVNSLVVTTLSPVLDTAIQVFREYHIQMDMREEDLQEVVDYFEQMRKTSVCSFTPTSFPSQAFELERQVITLELLADMNDLLYRVTSLSCYKGCGLDVFFPIVTNGSNYVEAGEDIELKMAVGSYSSAINANDIIIIANGDTISIGLDGIGDYSLRAEAPGKHTIATKCIITNSLTGEVQIGEGSYTYRSY